MTAPSNIQNFSDIDNFSYVPTSSDWIVVVVASRNNSGISLSVTKTVGGAPVTSVQDAYVDVTNSTTYSAVSIFHIENDATDSLDLVFTGPSFGNGCYTVMQVAGIDATTPVNLAVTSPNIAGGTGPFEITGTTTSTTSSTKMIISCVGLALNNSATVSGATIIQSGLYDGQITLANAYEEQTTVGSFTHGYTSTTASVRSPLAAVAYNVTAATPDITVDDYGNPSASRIFQRTTYNNKSVTITGTYANGTPTAIEGRIVQAGTSTPVTGLDWQTIDPSPTGGTFSGSLTVPEGGMYQAQVRWSNDTAKNASQTQDFGVGIGVIMYGQSNMDRMTTTTSSPPAQNAKTTWMDSDWTSVPAANGVRELLNAIVTLTGLPCFAFNSAQGGLSIDELTNPSTGWTDLTTKLTAAGGDAECMIWTQGEADGQDGTTTAQYKTDFTGTLQADLLTATGRSSSTFNCIISLLGNSNGYASYTDAKLEAIRDAQRELDAETGIVLSHTLVDQPLSDTIHMTAAGYAESGKRFAQTIAYLNGDVSYSAIGPRITSVTTSGSDVILTIAQDGGSGLTTTGTGDLDVFEVSDDDFATTETISTYSIDSATQITLGLSGAPEGPVKVRYNWGMDLALDNVIVDNTSLALPLFPETIAETVAPVVLPSVGNIALVRDIVVDITTDLTQDLGA